MFELPPLPFGQGDLEPHMDGETIGIHYGKHHQGYVNKLNNALGEETEGMTLDGIIKTANSLPAAVKNNAGGVWNHTFFWNCMAKDKNTPSSEMAAAIEGSFESMDKFKEAFLAAGAGVFGSGWVWLMKTPEGQLELTTTANQDHPWQTDKANMPVLVCDVWEHAYYLKYRNVRGDYLENFWQLINWENVEQHFNEGYSHGA